VRLIQTGMRVSALASVLLVTGSGCDGEHSGVAPPVVVYVSADESIARPVLAEFTNRTGIKVLPVFDTEATKTTGLASRLRSERERPRADLFWSSECFRTIELDGEGLLAPLSGEIFDDWMSDRPGRWKAEDGAWFGFAPRARVIVHRQPPGFDDPLPASWESLADPRWANRIAMADPRFGTTSGHFGALHAHWEALGTPERFDDWVKGLVENRPDVLTSGNAGVVDAVASGASDIGMTDTDDVWAARARGLDVELIYPPTDLDQQVGGGTLLVPNTVARIKGGPNPEGAHLLARWLLSEEVERILAASNSRNIPLRTDAGPLAVPDPLDVDLARSSALMEESIRLFRTRLKEQAE
jgi:iron(III) transport system substrate-binding protein